MFKLYQILLFLCCSQLLAADTLAQRCQAYAELGQYDRIIKAIENEHSQLPTGNEAGLQELTDLLAAHMETLLRARRFCNVSFHWDGDRAFGSTQYRTADLPEELRARPATNNKEILVQWFEKLQAYVEKSPNAALLDAIVAHLLRGECAPAREKLQELRRHYPTYCPGRLQEITEKLATGAPLTRLECMLLALRLPLGTLRETHLME